MVNKVNKAIFDSLEDANEHLKYELKSHIEYVKRQIDYYNNELVKFNQ